MDFVPASLHPSAAAAAAAANLQTLPPPTFTRSVFVSPKSSTLSHLPPAAITFGSLRSWSMPPSPWILRHPRSMDAACLRTSVSAIGVPRNASGSKTPGKYLQVRRVTFRPPGMEHNLLNEVTFSLPERSFGLIFGRSGSGKTTLLQLLAGLSKLTSGSISIQRYGNDGKPIQPPETLSPERVGIVFQFPERYFLADTVLEEITFGLPRQKADIAMREELATRLQMAINSVGLNTISLEEDPHALSGGFKRRLALAIQLVQTPELLLLDEPLAGLDWRARADIVKLLKHLKNKVTLLVVSHDLKELSTLVDKSWRMEMGGILKEEPLPI